MKLGATGTATGSRLLSRVAFHSWRGSQILRTANPQPALERLKANAHRLGPAHGLSSARNFAVGQIRLNQIDQGSPRFARIRRWQRVREDARLNIVAMRRIADYGPLESVENNQYRTQGIVGHVAGTARIADETQVPEAADATTLVMEAQGKGPVQLGNHEHGFGRHQIRVRRDLDFG